MTLFSARNATPGWNRFAKTRVASFAKHVQCCPTTRAGTHRSTVRATPRTDMPRGTLKLHLDIGVAAYLMGGLTRRWMLERIKSGEIDGYRIAGNKWVVSAASVEAWMENHRIQGAAA